MNQQYYEITEIYSRAQNLLSKSDEVLLPLGVPYLGMGSSYFACLAFKMMGVKINPEIASEYFNYLHGDVIHPHAVILSQSGRSSEALWCTKLFESVTVITNYTESPLYDALNATNKVLLEAGIEQYSSSNSYTNTLITLFKGFGFKITEAIDVLLRKKDVYERTGRMMADKVFELLKSKDIHGIYILGSGPNIATALQAALILSETTKKNFTGMAMAQYDHGPKETAHNSIVIQILARGKSYQRGLTLDQKVSTAGAFTMIVEEPEIEENFSVLHNIVPFSYMAYFLAKHLKISETFLVGGKVTEVNET